MYLYIQPFRERKKGLRRVLAILAPVVFFISVLTQAVFATSYVITDGSRVFAYTGLSADPDTALGSAGVELRPADSYTAGADAITVTRGQRLRVVYHGETMEADSAGETAGELLDRLGLQVLPEDTVTPAPDMPTEDGMEIRVDRITRSRQTYTVQLPHETQVCRSPQLPEGMREVLIPGRDGELLREAEVTYTNGVETGREILWEKQLQAPVTELAAVGTGALPGNGKTGRPVIGEHTITLPTGEVLTYTGTDLVRATAYTHTDAGCDTTTATGTTVRWGTVAVDPRYIPYGTRMFIMAEDGSYIYGLAEAEDCGGDIKGDRMDLYMPTFEDCMAFGRRRCIIYFLG